MASTRALVIGPMDAAQSMMRVGVHSRCFWWAFGMCSSVVVLPTALIAAQVRGALATEEEFHGGGGDPRLQVLVHQGVRRRVIVVVDLGVVVDVEPRLQRGRSSRTKSSRRLAP